MTRAKGIYSALLAVFGVVMVLARNQAEARFSWNYPPLSHLVISKNILADIGALTLGAHRVAADISYIQFLQYYGVFETDEGNTFVSPHSEGFERLPEGQMEGVNPDHDPHHGHDHGHHHSDHEEEATGFLSSFKLRRLGLLDHLGARNKELYSDPLLEEGVNYFSPVKLAERRKKTIYETGSFPQIFLRGTRTLRLDPFFSGAHLEVAGALAFNFLRAGEATRFLEEAVRRDPEFYRYRLYLAAVLYKGSGEDLKLLEILDEAIQYPDCPPMLENILASLHKKYGNYRRAVEVYVHTLATAVKKTDLAMAESRLVALIRERPDLGPYAASLLDK